MADNKNAVTSRQTLPHLRIEAFRTGVNYSPPPVDMSNAAFKRDRSTHGPKLQTELAAIFARAAELTRMRDPEIQVGAPGLYIEVEGAAGQKLPDLNWSSQDIRMAAVRQDSVGNELGTIFIPQSAQAFLTEKVREYATESTLKNKPKHDAKFAAVEAMRPASISSLWTDTRPFPEDPEAHMWWECWTWPDRAANLLQIAQKLGLHVSDRRLHFPEVEVIPVFASRRQVERILQNSDAIEELRRASDSPSFFMRTERRRQQIWIDDLVARIEAPARETPAVCIFDAGIARAHPLLAGAIAPGDCFSIHPAWGTDDHDPSGHGTNMAGLVLYADLTYPLADQRRLLLTYGLESVKILPPPGVSENDPQSYGAITQAAVALPEISNPNRPRVYCMAVTNEDVSGERPTSWSAALDQVCVGAMAGDPLPEEGEQKRRLIFVSAGNVPDASNPDEVSDLDEHPVEDPAQAWNAIAVGGFTDKTEIAEQDRLPEWTPWASAGDHSPYSRISTDWNHSTTPIKPEIVFEAGNKALSPTGDELVAGVDSLSLLTTHKDIFTEPVTTFWATSAATAQAAGMAAAIMAHHPEFWPETVRALLIHSAEWTPAMRQRLRSCNGRKRQCVALARQFGYGVPNLQRALASAENDLALIAQAEIQPFKRERKPNEDGQSVLGDPTFNEAHFYELPWPKGTLEQLSQRDVQLKVTLSYFIEPSPGDVSPITPRRYQSHGLRFELKRPGDTAAAFHHRVNGLEQMSPKPPASQPDSRWTFGVQSMAAGSVHCDVWKGPAAELAARGIIAVYPVSGWWRYRTHLKHYESKTRYSLIVSISSEETEVELYTEIAELIRSKLDIRTEVKVG
jgi:hypothetical protein